MREAGCPRDQAVSIHASAREATKLQAIGFRLQQFQSTPPRGRRRDVGGNGASGQGFQSTPPRGRRHGVVEMTLSDDVFQSTPPRGRRHDTYICFAYPVGFNPRLREGGDQIKALYMLRRLVSIHASAREATTVDKPQPGREEVSIHASAREATQTARCCLRWTICFNPRLREGGDRLLLA